MIDDIVISLAGMPYHIHPQVLLKTWTVPQALYAYINQTEQKAADARQQFILTMAAIGSVFSKDGEKIAKRILKTFDGGSMSSEELMETLSDTQKTVLFGKSTDGT